MQISRYPACILAIAIILNLSDLRAEEPSTPVREYCGASSNAKVGFPSIMRWDCQPVEAGSIKDLESRVSETHAKQNAPKFTAYFSDKPSRSAWFFYTDYAVHYRALFTGGEYKCLGVTTYCSSSEQTCESIEMRVAHDLPPPLMPDTATPGADCSSP